jgi:hypothetical protein
MSLVTSAPAWPEVTFSTTVRQFRRAVLVAFAAIGAGCLIYVVEKYLLAPPRRFVESPSEVMMRAFGLAHFLVGWLFLFTSPRLWKADALSRLGGLALIGIALCSGFFLAGAMKNPLVVMAFYSLFLVHEVRDEAHLFLAYGDGPTHEPDRQRVLTLLSLTACLVLILVLATAYLVNGFFLRRTEGLDKVSATVIVGGVIVLLTGIAILAAATFRLGLRVYGDLLSLLAAHAPLLWVYGGILTILVLGSLLGSVGFNLIILLHVTVWLVFVHHRLGQRQAPVGNLWDWLRGTPAGFVTLHLVAVVLILTLMAIRVHAWARVGLVSELLATSSFPYWSLMHIAMSFIRLR